MKLKFIFFLNLTTKFTSIHTFIKNNKLILFVLNIFYDTFW